MVTPLLPICNRPGSSLQVFVSTTLTSSTIVGIADIWTDQTSITTNPRGCRCFRLLQFLFRYIQQISNLTKLPSLHQSTRASTRPRTTHWTWSYIKIFSQEDFALRSKLWPNNFSLHRPIFAGNSHFTGISQLRAGKTRSKRPRSHWLSTVHLLPYMWASFYPLDPSRYLSSFSSWRPKTKKFPFFTNFHFALVKKIVGLLRTQFWSQMYIFDKVWVLFTSKYRFEETRHQLIPVKDIL